jgi:D-alanyl-D-alanine carboxypeptidase
MRHVRSGRSPQLRLATGAILAAATLAACSYSPVTTGGGVPGEALPPVSAPTEGGGPIDSTCVSDPAAVAARQPGPGATTSVLPSDRTAPLDAAAAAATEVIAAPGSVVAVRTPEGTWTKAYGNVDAAGTRPMTADVHQRIGSVTKTMTGSVLLQLVQEGRLGLDDTIGAYVDGIPNGDRITLRQLASMVSGVASYTRSTDFTDVYFADPARIFTPDELLAVAVPLSPLFEPGAQFDYSNTNTILLGKVIEQVTGQDIGTVFSERIFVPLGLTGTSWPGDSPELPDPHAQGYTLQGNATPENPADATNWNPAWGWTAGEAIATVPDLLVYARALGTGQGLLDPETQVTRLTSFPGSAGYGIALGCVDGWVGHTGELPGFNTSVFYDTTTDTSVVVAVNSDINSGDCADSPVLPGNPTGIPCLAPATRVFVAVAEALGHPFTPPVVT